MFRNSSRRCLFLLVAAVAFAALPAMAEEGKVTVGLPDAGYEIGDADVGHVVHMDDFGRLLVPGKPDLPSKIFSIALPPGAKVQDVTFASGAVRELDGSYSLFPVPLPRVVGDENPDLYARDLAMYNANHQATFGKNAFYPAAPGEFVLTGGLRKYNLVDVRFMPFQWNPATGKLRIHEQVSVTVTYEVPEKLGADVVTEGLRPRQGGHRPGHRPEL